MPKTITLDVLDNIEIANPCTASWDEMAGTEQVRHCTHCSLNVYNLSAMTREEATGIIAGAEGRVCVRLYRRTDGTVLTQDCPTGLRAARERVSRSIRNIAATVVTLVAGMIGLGARQAWAQGGAEPRLVMGGLPRLDREEPEKTSRATAQPREDTIAIDASRIEFMGQMEIVPVRSTPVPTALEPVGIDFATTEPAAEPGVAAPSVAEPGVAEPPRAVPLETEPDDPGMSLVMGRMVLFNESAPAPEDVVRVDGEPLEGLKPDPAAPVVETAPDIE